MIGAADLAGGHSARIINYQRIPLDLFFWLTGKKGLSCQIALAQGMDGSPLPAIFSPSFRAVPLDSLAKPVQRASQVA